MQINGFDLLESGVDNMKEVNLIKIKDDNTYYTLRIAKKYYEKAYENSIIYRVMYGVESVSPRTLKQFKSKNIEFDWIIHNVDGNHPINQHSHPLNLLRTWLKIENPV